MHRIKAISPGQFALFRIVFGGYLVVHFLMQLPNAAELFSNQGVIADPKLNPLHGIFPNPLDAWGYPAFITTFITALAVLSFAFAAGIFRRTTALLLWFGWAALFNRNNLISNPSLPYVGLILLLCTLVPPGESWSLAENSRRDQEWLFPTMVFWSAWLVMAAGYTFSGLIKLQSPSWVDGTAFRHLLNNPLARPGLFRDLLLKLGPAGDAALTWSVLALEILFLPLCLFRQGRMFAWTAMLGAHLGILLVVNFADLSLGMVMIHFFTFDPAWFPARCDARKPFLFYDGRCGLCNWVVRFLKREDSTVRIQFVTLQSNVAQSYLRGHGLPTKDFDSLVFVGDGHNRSAPYFLRTTAVLCVLGEIGGIWRAVSWFAVIPASWRDPLYDFVARIRYRFFGEYAPPPSPAGGSV
jgi:predicted DCC family thiol-disulfide oxidoreductase YuxK